MHQTVTPTSRATRNARCGAAALALVVLAGCTASSGGGSAPTAAPARPHTLHSVARELAIQDRIHRVPAYRAALGRLHARCPARSPESLGKLVDGAHGMLARRNLAGATRLAVMRSLAAGGAPTGHGDACTARDRALAAETALPARHRPYGGFAAPLTEWDAVHHADPAHPGGYRPRLPNGRDSLVIQRTSPVTDVTRQFDPPLSQALALATIRAQLLPPGLSTIYSLQSARCVEKTYTNSALKRGLGSVIDGVMIKLTSGQGLFSRYNPGLVDRAEMTVGTRRGGVSCS